MLEDGATIHYQNQHHKIHQVQHHKMIGMMTNDEIIVLPSQILIAPSSLQFEGSVANDINDTHS